MADAKKTPIIAHLKKLGVREATERYEKEKGVTTTRFAPLRRRGKKTA